MMTCGAAEEMLAAVFVVVCCDCDCTFVVALEVIVVAAVMGVVGVMVVWGVETWLRLEVEIGVESDVREDVLRDGSDEFAVERWRWLDCVVAVMSLLLLLSPTSSSSKSESVSDSKTAAAVSATKFSNLLKSEDVAVVLESEDDSIAGADKAE